MKVYYLLFYMSLFLIVMAGGFIRTRRRQTYSRLLVSLCGLPSRRIAFRHSTSIVLMTFCIINLYMFSFLSTLPAFILGCAIVKESISEYLARFMRKYTNVVFLLVVLAIAAIYFWLKIVSWRLILLYALIDTYSGYYMDRRSLEKEISNDADYEIVDKEDNH